MVVVEFCGFAVLNIVLQSFVLICFLFYVSHSEISLPLFRFGTCFLFAAANSELKVLLLFAGSLVSCFTTGSSPAVPGHVFSADKYQQRDAVLLKLQEESVEEFSDEVAPFTSRQIKEITETFVGSHKTDNLALFPKHSSSEKRLVILSPDAKNDGTSASIRNILQSPGNSVRTERTRGSQTRGSVGQRPRPDGDQRHVSGLGNARTS